MKKRFAALLLLGWLIPAGMAWAEPPVSVSHTLTSYTMGTDTVTASYTLNVKNSSTGSISNLILSLVPFPVISQDQVTLNITTLEPQAEVQIPFTLTTPMLLDQSMLTMLPMSWDCEGTLVDMGPIPIQFPVGSIEGGSL